MPSNRTAPGGNWSGGWRELEIARALLLWPPLWLVLGATLVALVTAYQVPHTYSVDVGSPRDQLYVRNFHARVEDDSHTYRWSGVYGYVSFPGIGGSRPFTATLALDPVRAAPIEIIINGESFFSGTLQPGWQRLTFLVDANHPTALASRDTVVEVRAPDYRTPDLPTQPKGLRVDSVTIEQSVAGGFITPPYLHTGVLLVGILMVYAFVGRWLWGISAPDRARRWGALTASAGGLALAFLVAQSHVAVAAASTHIVVTLGSMLVLLALCDAWARGSGGRLTLSQSRLLAASLAVAFGLRYGGMALPQSVIIDMPWHMKWLTTLLSGDWQSLYFPGGLSSVPREWGVELLIPKSPLFYFAVAPLRLLPLDLETTVKWLVCLLDATLVLAVFWLGLRATGSRWAAIAGAWLYSLMPLAFRAFAYGILPTIFAQWLAVAALLAFLHLGGGRNAGPARLVGVAVLLTLALLAFPTVALFVTLVLAALALAWWWVARRARISARFTYYVLGLLPIAWALAVWAYYGLYLFPMIASASALLAPQEGTSTVRWPGGWPELIAWTADYIVSIMPLMLSLMGIALLLWRWTWTRASETTKQVSLLLGLWLGIAPLFLLVNYKVDMIGKHLFFTMVPVAALGGVAIWNVARRGRWGAALAGLLLGVVAWQGIIFWIERLVRAST